MNKTDALLQQATQHIQNKVVPLTMEPGHKPTPAHTPAPPRPLPQRGMER